MRGIAAFFWFSRYFLLFLVWLVIEKPQTNVYCSPCAPEPLGYIVRVTHVDSGPAKFDGEREMVLSTKRDHEPCDVLTPAYVMPLNVVRAPTLRAPQAPLTRG